MRFDVTVFFAIVAWVSNMFGSSSRRMSREQTSAAWFAVACLVIPCLLWAGGSGCSERAGSDAAVLSASAQAADVAANGQQPEEIWESLYLQNAKIGYAKTTLRNVRRDGVPLQVTESFNHLEIARFGQQTKQDLTLTCTETPQGELRDFRTEVSFGPTPTVITGKVVDDQLRIETRTENKTQASQIPWSKDLRGFRAVEQSLAAKPLLPGEKRSLRMLMPLLNQIATIDLVAQNVEPTAVLGVEVKLLRIESVAHLADGQTMRSTLWTDTAGQAIKTRVAALNQETFRTTREIALAPMQGTPSFDLGSDLIIKLDRPLNNALRSQEVRYRVELAQQNPVEVFSTGDTQSIKSLDPHAAELTVRSLRPAKLPTPAQGSRPVDPHYLTANSVLQIDDPRIQALAREARGKATDPCDVAIALEKFVHRTMTNKNFTQAFATAAEVAESHEGDCTEHAVLLAALARACKIPSRVAMGLVYVERDRGFGYHMWTELYLNGRWVPMDATLGQGGIGAAHIKLSDSSLDGAGAYSSFLPVAQVAGQLKIQVLDAK